MLNDVKLTKRYFEDSNGARTINYGDLFCPMYGTDSVELTEENIKALLERKVLVTCINSEYTVLIRMKREDKE